MLAATLTVSSSAVADDNPATDGFSMSCSVTPDTTPDTIVDAGLQGVVAGESMTFANEIELDPGIVYQDILLRPDGSVYYASYIELIDLPSALVLEPGSVQFMINDVPVSVLQQATPDPTQFVLQTTGATTWRLLFPGDEAQMLADQTGTGAVSYVVGAPETLRLEFRAQMPVGTPLYQPEDGIECFASLSTGASNRDTGRPRVAVATVGNELNVEKTTRLDNAYVAGGIAEFTLVAQVPVLDSATLSHAVAPANNVVLVDNVPLGLEPTDAQGVLIADGGTTAGGGIWSAGARTITYTLGTLLPGDVWSTDELLQVDPASLPAVRFVNEVCGSFTSLSDPTPVVDAGCATAEIIVASEAPAVAKEALRIPDGAQLERYGVELPFWYEVTVAIPGQSSYENFTILDTLPDGVVFNSYVSAQCTPAGATCPTPIDVLAATVFPGGNGTGIGWYPNSLPFDANPRTITLRYEVQLAPTYSSGAPVQYFDEFINDVTINWNTVDRLGAVVPATASPPVFDGTEAAADTIVYDRPLLLIDKTVLTSDGLAADETRGQWDYEVGDIATYSWQVTNQGSSDAYNATIVDVPAGLDIDITTVLIDGSPCGAACSLVGAAVPATDLQVVLAGPIAPGVGNAVTVSYDAVPIASGELDNTVSIPTYEDEFETVYLENPEDTVGLVLPDPELTLAKVNALGTEEIANTVGTQAAFEFTVTNVSATTAYTPVVTDTTPPTGMCAVDDGLDASATGVTETAPGVWALDAPLAPGASASFIAWLEVCGPVEPGDYTNEATLTWSDLADAVDDNGDAYEATDDAPLTLIGAQFEVEKSPAVDAGALIPWSVDDDNDPPISSELDLDELNSAEWTIVVKNTGIAPIGGLNIVDALPDPYEHLVGSIVLDPNDPGYSLQWFPAAAQDTVTDNSVAAGSGAVWEADGYTNVVDLTIGQLAPGATVEITVPFVHNGEAPADGELTRLNIVEVRNDNLAFDADLHVAEGEFTLIPLELGPSVSKTVSQTSNTPGIGNEIEPGQPGRQVDFAIEVTMPTTSTTQTHDIWILDELPDGMSLVNEPAVSTLPPSTATDGWTVTCTSADCDTDNGGVYLGSQPGANGKTELAWFFGDLPIDADEEDRVYVITFRAQVDTTFANGDEIIDGTNEPLINVAKPIFNRDATLPGGDGDQVPAANPPTSIPDPDTYERVFPLDPAQVDVVTPRLDLDKIVEKQNDDGEWVEVEEITAGDTFRYTVTATNIGSGDASAIDINDTLGTPPAWTGENFLTYLPATLAVDPATGSCATYQPFAPDPVEHLLCELDGPLAPSDSFTIVYEATTVDAEDFFAQASTANFDPMIILNEATAPEYWDSSDGNGNGTGNSYSTGSSATRLFAYTPIAEIDVTCSAGFVDVPAGADTFFDLVFGNGDRIDRGGNGDGDRTPTPWPEEDLDGDGFPDAGVGFSPELRITLQDKFTFLGVDVTGPGAGDPTYTTFTALVSPDQTVVPGDEGPGTYTLVWDAGTLADIPMSPDHDEQNDFQAWMIGKVNVTKTLSGGGTIWGDLILQDAAGNFDRGTAVGEPWTFAESHRQGCPGGPPLTAEKVPDQSDGVIVPAGGTEEFVIYLNQIFDDPVPSTFTDLLPAGLVYAGDLAPTDPDFAVATIDDGAGNLPAGWSPLVTYENPTSVDGSGNTTISWNPPDLPTGTWVLRVPVKALGEPLFPGEFVVNSFTWDADGTIRSDTGAILTQSAGVPSLDKRVQGSEVGLYGEQFTFVVEVTLPAGFAGQDIVISDQINRWSNWDASPYSFQELGVNWSSTESGPMFPHPSTLPLPASGPGEFRALNWAYSPAEMELGTYVSANCIAGCGGVGAAIDVTPLPPDPLDTAGTLPVSTANPEVVNSNGQIGWYLGDVTAATEERVLNLVYTVEAPTLLEQRQRVADLNPTAFPGGGSDPAFDDRDSRMFEELSQIRHPNLVTLKSLPGNAAIDDLKNLGPNDWEDPDANTSWVAASTPGSSLAIADEMVTVAYPLIDMTKDCGAVGGTGDPLVVTHPLPTNGIPNVECTITVENQSPVDAFDVNVTDAPLDGCRGIAVLYDGRYNWLSDFTSSNPWNPARSAPGTGLEDPADPLAATYPCDVNTLVASDSTTGTAATTGANFPLVWDLTVAGNETETLTYQFFVDGWSNQPLHTRWNNGAWDFQGAFVNEATLSQWTAAPDSPDLIGEVVVERDFAAFPVSAIEVQKFPFPVGRNPCTDNAWPFINWNKAPEASLMNLTWWDRDIAGDRYNPANINDVAGIGNPLNSEFWTEGRDYCGDLLQPVDRELSGVFWYHDRVRSFVRGTYPWDISRNGWQRSGNIFYAVLGDGTVVGSNPNDEGWSLQGPTLANPYAWGESYYATPTESYRWVIDIRADALHHIDTMDITDTLPVGWEYVPGSAKIIDGSWLIGLYPGGTYSSEIGIPTGYGEITLPDPATANAPDGTPECHFDSNFHSGGQEMTWNFERDGGGDGDAPWLYQYLDRRQAISNGGNPNSPSNLGYTPTTTGHVTTYSWITITYEATPLMEVFDCDPDATSSDPFMMENNVELTSRRAAPVLGQSAEMSTFFDALVPVTNPVNFEKLPDDDYVPDESTGSFTIRFENNLSEPVLDLLITDELRGSIPSIGGGGYSCSTATATIDGVAIALNETQCDNPLTQATDLGWLIPQIDTNQVLEITIPIVVPKDEFNGLRWDNTASTVVNEFFDSPFTDDGRITVANPSPPPLPVKVVTPNPATINDTVTYEISWTANSTQVFMDLAYIDTVPDGLTFVDHVGVSCSGGCPNGFTADDVLTITPQVNADGTTTLMWWFGDMPGSNQAHTWTMTYTALVDDTYTNGVPVLDEDTLVNLVTGYASDEDLITADPTGLLDPSAWDESEHLPTAEVQGVLDIEEPELEITKSAVPLTSPLDGSGVIEYTVMVQNVGGMAAYNVAVTDTPNNALENIVTVDPNLTDPDWFVTQGWTAVAPELGWFITELDQGETAFFTYTAEIVDTFLTDGIWVADNDASVDEFFARPGVEPAPGDRSYVGGETNTSLPLTAPEVKIDKTLECADEFAFVEIGTPVPWCLVVQNVGDSTAFNVTVVDELPFNWTYDPGSTAATATGGAAAPGEPTVITGGGTDTVEWNLGDVPAGAVVEIQFDAIPQNGAPQVTTNWASVQMTDAAGNALPGAITQARDRDPASASIGEYGLEISKTPDEQQFPYIPNGGVVTWELTITNPATDTTNTNLVVTDFLPDGLDYAGSVVDVGVTAGVTSAGPNNTTQIEWIIDELGPLESTVIEIQATAGGDEVPLQWYVNDVQVTSDQIGDLVANQAKVRFFEPASVGDFVWQDTDVDGIQDPGETGVNGVLVTLLDGNGDPLYRNPATGMVLTAAEWATLSPADQAATPIMTLATGNDPATGAPGWYEFTDLPAGSYQIQFDPTPSGLLPTLDDQGADDAADSDADRFTGLSHVFTLVPGQHDPTIDMGLITPEQFDESLADIDVEKWTEGLQADIEPGPLLMPGAIVIWSFQVTNTGWTSLADVTVIDSVEGPADCDVDADGLSDGTNLIPLLLPGESRNCFIENAVGIDAQGAGTGQYANSALTSGTPVLPDFDTCECDPDDPTSWPTDPALNSPALDTNGEPLIDVDDDDPSHHFSVSPSIDIEKDTNGFDADTPQGPVILAGETVTWTYEVENSGNTALANVTVDDDQNVAVICDVNGDSVFDDATGPVIGFMLPGDTVTCQGTGSATNGDYANIGDVTGDPVLPDPATCNCELSDPDNWPDDPTVFTPALNPDGTTLNAVDDEDPSHYLGASPSVDIEKDTNLVQSDDAPGEPIAVGDDVTWSYVVENTGTTALLDVTIMDSDPNVTVDCDPTAQVSNVIELFIPGEIVTCTATGVAGSGAYANTATVVGTPAFPTDPAIDPTNPDAWPTDPDEFTPTGGDDVDDSDDSHYFGVEGGLVLEKATNGVDADTAPGVALNPGDAVVWTYVVTNTSSVMMLDVTVTDSDIGAGIDCGDGTNVVAALAPGQVVTCTSIAAANAAAGAYQNDSDVTGIGAVPTDLDAPGVVASDPATWPTDPSEFTQIVDEPFTDEDPSNLFALAGGLVLEKSTNGEDSDVAPGEQILEDGSVVWTYAVTNNSNTVMIDVLVEDLDLNITVDCGGGSDRIPVLAVGETVACTATGTAELGDYRNDSTVEGTPAIADPANPDGPSDDPDSYVPTGHDPSTDEDPSNYYGSDPSIVLEKDTNGDDADTTVGPVLAIGADVTWTYVVTNDGNVALTDVTVTDSDPAVTIVCAPSTDNVIPLLAVGAEGTCVATGIATLGAYENLGEVSGTPAQLTDPDADPDDPDSYEPSGLDPVDDDDLSHYVAHDGDLMIVKTTNDRLADVVPGVQIITGDPVIWEYTVVNTSTTPLINLIVTDDQGEAVDCGNNNNSIAVLLPGATQICTATGIAAAGQYSNIGDVVGTPALPNDNGGYDPIPGAEPATDENPSNYFGGVPSIEVEKDTNGDDADTTVGPLLEPGDDVTWTYVISNTGDFALTDVTVTDSDPAINIVCAPSTDNVIPLLVAGAEATCVATGTATLGAYENLAVVSGTPAQIADPTDPDVDPNDPDSYEPSGLDPVDDDDPSHYLAATAEVGIEKATNTVQSDNAPGEPIAVGDDVTWSYVVTNLGTTGLVDVTVTDSDPAVSVVCEPSVDNTIALLIPGEIVTCVATGVAGSGAYANTATVDGTPVLPSDPDVDPTDPDAWPTDPDEFTPTGGDDVDDADDSHYFGVEGGLVLEKATNGVDADIAPGVALNLGDAVVWTYEVTNTSSVMMLDVTVSDSDIGAGIDCGDGTNVVAALAPGQVVTCTSIAPATAAAGAYQNDSDVTGIGAVPTDLDAPGVVASDPATWPTDPSEFTQIVDEPFTDEDPSNLFALAGGLVLEKSTNGEDSDVAPGEQIPENTPVTWTYAVTNNSNTVMINVLVEDLDPDITVDCGGGSNQIPVLAVGETISCTATGTAELGDYRNDSTVEGTPAIIDPANPNGPTDDPGSYVPTGHDPSTDEDPSNYYGSDPSIVVEKDTNGDDADTTVGPLLSTGDAVTWTYVITNDGNVAFTDVTVTDSDPAINIVCAPSTDNVIPLLVAGAEATCVATGTASLGAYENLAVVSGTPAQIGDPTDPDVDPNDPDSYEPSGLDPVDDDDLSHYVAHDGDVKIVKKTNDRDANTIPGVPIVTGDPVIWEYTVINTSTTPLINLIVNDDQGETIDCGDSNNSIAVLLPGATHVCTATGIAAAGQYSNIGDVVGTPASPNGNGGYDPIPDAEPATDEDPSNYFGGVPSIAIEKATNGSDSDQAPGEPILEGDAIEWTYSVTNSGTQVLVDIEVTDDQGVIIDCGDGTATVAMLAPQATVTCTGEGQAGVGPYTNTGSVSGTPGYPNPNDPDTFLAVPDSVPATDEDISHYDGVELIVDLALQKKAVSPADAAADGRSFTIEVFNQGTVTASDIMIVDYPPTGMTIIDDDWTVNDDGTATHTVAGPLAPGESVIITLDTEISGFGDYQNLAGIEAASTSHPVTGDAISLGDIDSEFGDSTEDVLIDDVLDNEGGDEDDSDIANVTRARPAVTPTTPITPSSPGRISQSVPPRLSLTPDQPAQPPAPSRPGNPLALTGANSGRLISLGVLLLAVGVFFVALGARRRRNHREETPTDQ